MSDRLSSLRSALDAHDQAHVLTYVDDLTEARVNTLLEQIESIDLQTLDGLVEQYVKQRPDTDLPANLGPTPVFTTDANDPTGTTFDADAARERGEAIIREGGLAAFTVAGGQGTRLGWAGPKGTYPATPVSGKPLFRLMAEQILAAQRRYDVTIPWYIMTSPINDAETRGFFLDNNCFGLRRSDIMMFPQGTMPSLDKDTGRLLLADRGTLAVNPDGHGGAFRALRNSGALEDMEARGVRHLSYFQIDNPLVRVIDPVFLGLHAGDEHSDANMSSKVVEKTNPEEKVGVICNADGRTMVVEYSDLPETLAQETDEHGRLRYNAGSIAIHLIGLDFALRLTEGTGLSLPFHRAEKAVPHVDLSSGELVSPESPNAVKLEMFVFDALPEAGRSVVFATRREAEFAPIKNRRGTDSPATSHQLQSDLHGGWLEAAGVTVDRDGEGHVLASIEISPLTATSPDELAGHELPDHLRAGDSITL